MGGERLFCDTALAARIERAEARLTAACSDASEGVPSHEDFPRETLMHALRDMAGVRRYVAEREGEFAGGAGFRVTDGIAQCAEAGCDVAVVTTQPGSKSQQNAQRQGFDLLYARAILVKGVSSASSSGADSRQAS